MISICIPAYEMGGQGDEYLYQSFKQIAAQTYRDFEVVVSDHSLDTRVQNCCKRETRFPVRYYHNPDNRGSSSANINNAMRHAEGDIIKVLFQDDYLYHMDVLGTIAREMGDADWLVTACMNSDVHGPVCFTRPHPAINTIGCPSVLAVKNEGHLEFDKNLKWLMDCEYYRRCWDTFGAPKIFPIIGVAIGHGDHQVTGGISRLQKVREHAYVNWKHVVKPFYKSVFGAPRRTT
jgi:glycosyltransferase involved in cell wall biosynthesis